MFESMERRNMLCTGQMTDLLMDERNQRPHVTSAANFPHTNMHTMLSAPGNSSNFDVRILSEHYDGSAILYGIGQYNGPHHRHPVPSLDLGVASGSNIYNPYLTPSPGSRGFTVSMNHGSSDQFPSSSSHGVIGVSADIRDNHFIMDGVRGAGKRKNAEGIQGHGQHINGLASSSSSVPPFNTRHPESGVSMMDSASFVQPQYRGNNTPSIMELGPSIVELGSHRSVRNRSGAVGLDSVLAHNHNNLVQGNYIGHPLPPGNPWVDQQSSNNGRDVGALAWNHGPPLPYFHGTSFSGGAREAGNVGIQGYHDTSSGRSSTNYLQPPVHHQHHNLRYSSPALPPMQRTRSHFHPQVVSSSFRLPINSRGIVPPEVGIEAGPRHPGPVAPTGIRIYRSHQGALAPEGTLRHRNVPNLRICPPEEVAILDLDLSEFYEVGDPIDHHRDMRLDIEHMSYEELLALGDWIGNVSTGLSEESVTKHLKTRTYISPDLNLERAASMDHENDCCIICQEEYQHKEKVGQLGCGHEYHADCLKKWLLVKNVCPICKAPGISPTQ